MEYALWVARKIISILGELLLTLGVLILLFVVYQVWFSNLASQAEADRISNELIESFELDYSNIDTGSEDKEVSSIERKESEGFALLYVPRLKDDVWGTPILDGITESKLAKGIGHYPTTELPGEVGNFSIAGHRATYGEPFARFERLQVGDNVVVRTVEGWFVYQLKKDQIVLPSEVWVLNDVPTQDFSAGSSLITLTTCDPRWNSYQRWIWWGELVSVHEPKDIPVEVLEG